MWIFATVSLLTVIVLVAVSLVYIVTMSPLFVGIALDFIIDWRTAPGIELAKYKLFYALAFNICLLNSSTNFFTYCLGHPQFLPEVKLCFAALVAKIGSMFQKYKNRNTVGTIHVRGVQVATASISGIMPMVGTASTYGITPKLGAASTSGLMSKVSIANNKDIQPKGNTSNEIETISEDSL